MGPLWDFCCLLSWIKITLLRLKRNRNHWRYLQETANFILRSGLVPLHPNNEAHENGHAWIFRQTLKYLTQSSAFSLWAQGPMDIYTSTNSVQRFLFLVYRSHAISDNKKSIKETCLVLTVRSSRCWRKEDGLGPKHHVTASFKVICICYKSITEENKIAYVLKHLVLCGAEWKRK